MNRTLAGTPHAVRLAGLLAALVATLAALAVTTPPAPGDVLAPAVTLGPITVVNGTATVAGALGAPGSGVALTVNGQPLAVDGAGNFAGTINLNGQTTLTFRLSNSAGEVMSLAIPLTANVLGTGGIISQDVLGALEKAAVAILKPAGGFRIQDALPLRIQGSVGDPASLAGLTVNGNDALSTAPGSRTFSMLLPGTTREVSVTATDTRGVSQTSIMPVQHTSSVLATPAGRSVAATGALGVQIAKIRYITKAVRRTKRLRIVVTVKDRRGLLIRNATVSVRSKYAARIVRNPRAKKTNRVGQAAFLLRARNRAFGRRLVMMTVARTPAAKASKASSVRIPRLRAAAARR